MVLGNGLRPFPVVEGDHILKSHNFCLGSLNRSKSSAALYVLLRRSPTGIADMGATGRVFCLSVAHDISWIAAAKFGTQFAYMKCGDLHTIKLRKSES